MTTDAPDVDTRDAGGAATVRARWTLWRGLALCCLALLLVAATLAAIPGFEDPRWLPAGAGELQPAIEAIAAPPRAPGLSLAALVLLHLACPASFTLLWALQRQELRASRRALTEDGPHEALEREVRVSS